MLGIKLDVSTYTVSLPYMSELHNRYPGIDIKDIHVTSLGSKKFINIGERRKTLDEMCLLRNLLSISHPTTNH